MSTQAPEPPSWQGDPWWLSRCHHGRRASLTQAPSPPPSGSESASAADSERRVRVLQCHHTQKFQIGGTCFQVPGEPAWVPVPPSRWLFLAGAVGQAAGTPAGLPLPSESRIVGDGGEPTQISVPVQCAQQKSTVSELQSLKKSADSDIYHPWQPEAPVASQQPEPETRAVLPAGSSCLPDSERRVPVPTWMATPGFQASEISFPATLMSRHM